MSTDDAIVPSNESHLSKLATAANTIILRRPLQLIWVVGPALVFHLVWSLYRVELAALTQAASSNGESIGLMVSVLILLAAMWSFGISHVAHTMQDARFWIDGQRGVEATLERMAEEKSAVKKDLDSANERLSQWAGELEGANERLRELDTLKSKFVAEVGHELRAPLAAIVSAGNIIVRHHKTKPEAVERFGNTIVTEGKRLARLVNDLLDLTKIEADCVEWEEENTDITELINQAILGVEPVAINEQVTLHTELSPDLPQICIDRDRILQVLTNLLNNALKFTPKGGQVTTAVSHNAREFVFSVKDTGVGIAEEDCHRIFDRFVQARSKGNQNAKTSAASTGLGLCISKEIVEHYGGRIWVESQIGKGSTFSFAIPTSQGPAEASPTPPIASRLMEPLSVAALLESDELADSMRELDPSGTVTCEPHTSVEELTADILASKPDAVLISERLVPEAGSPLFEAMRDRGMTELLVHSRDGRIRARSIRDSSALAARKLRYHVSNGSHILLVDDDPKFRDIVEWELHHAGFTVRTAADGREALAILESEKVDALLLDVMLPHLDGISVLEKLTHLPHKIPVIMLTAMDDDEIAVSAKQLGAVDFIRKDGIEAAANTHALARIQRIVGAVLSKTESLDTEA